MSGKNNRIATMIKTRIARTLDAGYKRENGTIETPASVFILTLKGQYEPIEKSILGNYTQEINNAIRFYIHDLKGDYNAKSEQEEYHYEMLKYGLLHQIRKTFYFHPGETLESRKFIIFSDDCISSIQFLCREEKAYLMVHMRSSDLVGLFTPDVLFLTDLLMTVLAEHDIPLDSKGVELSIVIGSAHIYEKDVRRAEDATAK